MKDRTATKREKEKALVSRMIALYCRKRHVWESKKEKRRIGERT